MWIKKIKKGSSKLTKEKARIIAHLIGDGSLSKSRCNYALKLEVRDNESLQQFHDDIIKVYGLRPFWNWNTSGFTGKPIRFVSLRSKLAYEDLLRYATAYSSKDWKLKPLLLNSFTEIKREFLRTLFDDEGSVRNKYSLVLYSINDKGLLQVKDMLKGFGIDSKLQFGYGCKRNVCALEIKDFKLFNKQIGFNLVRKQEKLNKFL